MKKILSSIFAISFFMALNAAEIKSIWPLPSELRAFDKNADNLIQGEELTDELAVRFDLNCDGIITPSEGIFVFAQENFQKERPDYKEPRFDSPQKVLHPKKNFQNTILISCDGLDRAVLKELLEAGKLPVLEKLSKLYSDTCFVVNVKLSGHQTETKPGHAVMVTGLIPEFSLVQTNSRFQPVPTGLTIHERIKAHNPSIKTAFISSKRENVGAMTAEELGNRVEKGIKIEGGPYLNAKENIDIFSATDKNPDDAKKAFIEAIEQLKDDAFFAFFHFRSPDKEGHAHGRESDQYKNSVEKLDSCIGSLIESLQKNGISEKTRIIITADHGFNPNATHHKFAPWITMITNDPELLTDQTPFLFDIPATIMALFGVDLEKLDPKPFGKDIRTLNKN